MAEGRGRISEVGDRWKGEQIKKKIVIVTGASLSWAPRAPKEASALAEAGFEVVVLGASANQSRLAADTKKATEGGYRFVAVDDGVHGPAFPLPVRLRAALSAKMFSATGATTPWIFSPWATRLARRALELSPSLAICHLEPGLWVGSRMSAAGVPVGIDMEDWYSEDLPPQDKKGRPVDMLRHLERNLLRHAVHATCPSEAMADALAEAYQCPRPVRIYNVFPKPAEAFTAKFQDRSESRQSMGGMPSRGRDAVSIHWFSQTLGPGRGLEELMTACSGLEGAWEIHLRGALGGYAAWLEGMVPISLRHKIFLHDLVPNEDLAERIAEHDIGFAGEVATIRSRDLTATNKIFQYLQSGLAVVASDTAGQREVAALAGAAVRTYRGGDCNDLRCVLEEWLHSPENLRAAKVTAGNVAAEQLNWDKEKGRFIESVREAFVNPREAVTRG
jgi:hypothetical protein